QQVGQHHRDVRLPRRDVHDARARRLLRPVRVGQQLAAGHVEHGRVDRVGVKCLRVGVHGRRHLEERDGERAVLVASPGRPTPGRWPGVREMKLVTLALFLGCTATEAPKVAPPPAIVFDWLRNGNRDIYRAALDGKDTVRLTSDPGDDQHPTERAGTVVFTSYRDGNGELYAVPSTGGAERRLTTTAANETQPALSPDGRHIAYLSDESGVPKLWLCDADGTNPRALTVGFGFPGSIEASPSWAPSGDRLVFVSTANGHAGLFILTP